jgi:hypothetical protein
LLPCSARPKRAEHGESAGPIQALVRRPIGDMLIGSGESGIDGPVAVFPFRG